MLLSTVLVQMVKLFIVIIVGYFLHKVGFLDSTLNKQFSHFVVNVTLPAMILGTVLTSTMKISLNELGMVLAGTLLYYGVLGLSALVLPGLIPASKSERGTYRFVAMFGNVGFIGYPVIQSIWGGSALFYAIIANRPFNLLLYTVGIQFLESNSSQKKIDLKMFVNPGMISSLLAILFVLTDIAVPSIVGEVCELIGQISTPLSLLIIGAFIADLPLREIMGGRKVWIISMVRLLVGPFLLMLILPLVIPDPMIRGVLIVMSGMPAGTNGLMLCMDYGGESKIMAETIFFTTLLSILSIPLIVSLLG